MTFTQQSIQKTAFSITVSLNGYSFCLHTQLIKGQAESLEEASRNFFLGWEETNFEELFFCFLSIFAIKNNTVPPLSETVTKPLVYPSGAREQNQQNLHLD